MKIRAFVRFIFFISLFAFTLVSCKPPQNEFESDGNLWTDVTDTYLPTTAEWTNRVEVADINGDGLIDLAFANGGNYSEPGPLEFSRVFINKGPYTQFEEITNLIFKQEKYYARVIKIQDIDNDQIPDMVIGTTFQTQSQLYKGLGKGEFQNVTNTHLPNIKSSVGDIELGDVDDDGDLDMVLVDWGPGSNMNNSGGRTMLWLNDGSGKFTDFTKQQMPDLLIQFSWDIELIDYDNDFNLDIAISCKRCGTSRLFQNDGTGNFKDIRAIPAYTNNYEFEPMDVNNDGFLDLITINDGEIVKGIRDSRREHIFLNKNGESFYDATEEFWPPNENIGEDDNNVVFLDYDSDGDPDFIISSLTGEDRLLINDGTGKFKLSQPVLKGSPTPSTLSIVLGDINNDKKLDIIMGQGEGDTGIEERIFIGDKIKVDTAPPIISHHQVTSGIQGKTIIKARIQDNKSPNMPQDWSSIELSISDDQGIPMIWYGENLWKVSIPKSSKSDSLKIIATDFAGNTTSQKVR